MVSQTQDVEQLVGKAKNGDGDAFEQLFKRFGRSLFTTILRIVRNYDDAEEVLQESFLKMHRRLASLRTTSGFYSWAYTISVNTSINFLKSRDSRRESQLERTQWDSIAAPADCGGETAMIREAVQSAIEKVPPKQRAVLVMRVYDGMDYASIARTLGCSEGAAKANFFHAMNKLRKYLSDYR